MTADPGALDYAAAEPKKLESGRPDPRRSYFHLITGIKGSGKTEYAWYVFDSYPFDRLVLDVTHDVTELLNTRGVPHRQITAPIPGAWPEWMRDPEHDRTPAMPHGRLTLVFKPDMGAPEARDDLDRCVGLCLRGGGPGKATLCWADEIGEVCRANHTGPGMRRALHHGRHDDLSLLMCGPRPKDIDTLCAGQADKVVTFRTLNRYDREAIADNIGQDRGEFSRLNAGLREYEHTVWTRASGQIEVYGPLPRWQRGRRAPDEIEAP